MRADHVGDGADDGQDVRRLEHDGHRPGVRNGAVGTMLGSYDSSYAYSGAQQLEINGTAGRASIQDTVRSLTISRAGDEVEQRWQAGYFNDEARSSHRTFDRHVDAVLSALRGGQQPPVHARALQLAVAVIASHAQGTRVSTDPA